MAMNPKNNSYDDIFWFTETILNPMNLSIFSVNWLSTSFGIFQENPVKRGTPTNPVDIRTCTRSILDRQRLKMWFSNWYEYATYCGETICGETIFIWPFGSQFHYRVHLPKADSLRELKMKLELAGNTFTYTSSDSANVSDHSRDKTTTIRI